MNAPMCMKPVMRIGIDLQVHEIWELGSTLKSVWAKPSQQRGNPARASLSSMGRRGCWISLLLESSQDGLIRSSTIDAIAAQVRHNK